jgi:hypothetical protein
LENIAMGDDGNEGMAAVVRESGLRLRESPKHDGNVLTEMPAGAKVVLSGHFANGFAGLTFDGREGWAFLTYLEKESDRTPVGPIARVNKYAVGVPLHHEPSQVFSDPTSLTQIPGGAVVAILGEESERAVPVAYEGVAGFAAARSPSTGLEYFIYGTLDNPWALQADAPQPVQAVVREPGLNFRNKPSLDDSRVTTVMPPGTKVVLHDDFKDGFAAVTLGVAEGWAFLTYLEMESDKSPVGPIARVVEFGERVVPLYKIPDETSTPVAEMPGGTLVAVLGEEERLFIPVSYEGIVGYARTRSPGNADELFIYGSPDNPWALQEDRQPLEMSG